MPGSLYHGEVLLALVRRLPLTTPSRLQGKARGCSRWASDASISQIRPQAQQAIQHFSACASKAGAAFSWFLASDEDHQLLQDIRTELVVISWSQNVRYRSDDVDGWGLTIALLPTEVQASTIPRPNRQNSIQRDFYSNKEENRHSQALRTLPKFAMQRGLQQEDTDRRMSSSWAQHSSRPEQF